MMEFNVRQQNVINSKDKNILCLACAASGKTATLVGRINRLLSEGENPKNIVCFTFTNQAAAEMKSRIGEKGKGMFIGTAHSYANYICSLAGVENYDIIKEELFDDIIKRALMISQRKYPKVQYLFVDEFQDTDMLQYQFIEKIPAENRFYCGDERQFIYSFKKSTDEYIRSLADDVSFKNYFLTQNYRNPANIIRYAENYIASLKKISPKSVPTIKEEGFIDENCTITDAIEEITWSDNYGKWAILCRTNAELYAIAEKLQDRSLPHLIIKRGDLDLEQLNSALKENKIKVMTVHSSKGLEFDNVVVVGCKAYNEDERRLSYVAATRAKEALYWCPPIRMARKKKKIKLDDASGMVMF